MARRLLLALGIAVIGALGLWGWWPAGSHGIGDTQPLGAAALATLAPDPASDQPIEQHLRSLVPPSSAAWRRLPPAGQALWATLACEQVDHGISWPVAVAWNDGSDSGVATLDDAATGYELLGVPEAAHAVRVLDLALAADHDRLSAWQHGSGPRVDTAPYERLAAPWRAQLHAIRTARLALLREHAADLGVR